MTARGIVHKVLTDMHAPAAYIDFFMAHDDASIASRILTGVGNALAQIMPMTQKTLQVLQKTFSHLKLAMTVAGIEFSASYHNRQTLDATAQIYEALQGLALIAAQKKKQVVLFIDEFQDIINAEHAQTIQGALRSIAQEYAQIVFIFSGSSRHLLLDIFDDRKKPFYMLCDKIELERMSSEHYFNYIQSVAQEKWGGNLSDAAYAAWIQLTELHPFYMNLLGNEICKSSRLPDADALSTAWDSCRDAEHRRLIAEVEYLTLNQQKVLKFLAQHPSTEPLSQAVLSEINLSGGSVRLCLKTLLERDIIFKVAFEDPRLPLFQLGQYRVLDPLLAYAIRAY